MRLLTDTTADEADHEAGISGNLRRDLELESGRSKTEQGDVDSEDDVLAEANLVSL